jgi:hypothetical protein
VKVAVTWTQQQQTPGELVATFIQHAIKRTRKMNRQQFKDTHSSTSSTIGGRGTSLCTDAMFLLVIDLKPKRLAVAENFFLSYQ